MLDELTPEQRAKLARGWVWRPGHAFVQSHPKTGVCDYSNFARVSCVVDGEPMAMRGVGIGNPHPVLTDDVTTDGLLRTARAMWRDESLCCSNDRSGWYVRILAKSHPYAPVFIARGETEQAALLAAILAAPEAA